MLVVYFWFFRKKKSSISVIWGLQKILSIEPYTDQRKRLTHLTFCVQNTVPINGRQSSLCRPCCVDCGSFVGRKCCFCIVCEVRELEWYLFTLFREVRRITVDKLCGQVTSVVLQGNRCRIQRWLSPRGLIQSF